MLKKVFTAVFIIVVFILLYVLINWYQTKKSLAIYARETVAGTSLVSAGENARKRGFRFANYSSAGHKAFVTATGVMGRYVCVIEHDGKKVVKTSLSFND